MKMTGILTKLIKCFQMVRIVEEQKDENLISDDNGRNKGIRESGNKTENEHQIT